MGTLSGILRVYEEDTVTTKSAAHPDEQALLRDSPVWRALDQMSRWNAAGHVPSRADLDALGVKLPRFLQQQ